MSPGATAVSQNFCPAARAEYQHGEVLDGLDALLIGWKFTCTNHQSQPLGWS